MGTYFKPFLIVVYCGYKDGLGIGRGMKNEFVGMKEIKCSLAHNFEIAQ